MTADPDRLRALVHTVAAFLADVSVPRRHHIACGLALRTGGVVLGLNIVSGLGPASVCAEPVAMGEALKRRAVSVELVVSLRATFDRRSPYEVVPPCGRCRELLWEYAPDAEVILAASTGDPDDVSALPVTALLPHPFRRRLEPVAAGLDGHPILSPG